MTGEPFTAAVLHATFWHEHPLPPECVGGFLRTSRGTTYRLEAARQLPSGAWRLDVTRWPPGEVPDDALVIAWSWTARKRKAGRA